LGSAARHHGGGASRGMNSRSEAACFLFYRVCVYVLMNLGEDAAIAAFMFC
jgi:hypothetical protein